jgi:tetrapyrrole methylase family protein/MazG family protein
MSSGNTNIQRLLRIVARLRGPGGCPWDREQTHQSIRHDLIEESYEVLEAMDSGNASAFCEELGDLLLQVVFHAQIAGEARRFTFDDVAGTIADKLVRRHPHVFGSRKLKSSRQVLAQWENIKKNEKAAGSIVAHVPRYLPALMKADKVQRKVARVGFDWRRVEDVVAKVEEELAEVRQALASGNRKRFEEELGDLLFAAVNLARFQKLHAEELLNRTIARFVRRFQEVERAVHRQGGRLEDCTLEEMDALWETAKRRQLNGAPRRAGRTRRQKGRSRPAPVSRAKD